jgi:osmotically-inducible protein OsmY
MKLILASLLLGAGAAACSKHDTTTTTGSGSTVHAANNPTAIDQPNNEVDLALVQSVRRALVDDDTLSVAAKNVTAVAQSGTVTLKGEVATQAEKDHVEACVRKVSGVQRVDSQITVKAN